MSDQHDRHAALKEVRRFTHGLKALVAFADELEELDRLATETAEVKLRLDALKKQEAEARERVAVAEKQATDRIAAGKVKASQLIADAERHAQQIASNAEAAAAQLSKDTAALAAAQAQLGQVRGELENLRARLN
jgi:hypothetical protein